MEILIIGGPPGIGKGTLSHILEKELSLKSLSTGDILREEIASGSELGKEISKLIDEGNFVSDELINKLILK
jgi:adenylate kinase